MQAGCVDSGGPQGAGVFAPGAQLSSGEGWRGEMEDLKGRGGRCEGLVPCGPLLVFMYWKEFGI